MTKGYKAKYNTLTGDFVTIDENTVQNIPAEIAHIFNKWKAYGRVYQEDYYKNIYVCPVKLAQTTFRYKGVNYKITPKGMKLKDAYFEYLMLRHVEDDLVDIGAEEVFCIAMVD